MHRNPNGPDTVCHICKTSSSDSRSVQEGRSAPVSDPVAETLPRGTTVAFPGGHRERIKGIGKERS